MPRVSVIVPAYNGARTILETLRSVQAQTFSDYELIVVDDGSTDDTLELLAGLGEPRLRVFSYDNGGLAIARNRGIERATAPLVAFVDADDLWTPDKLEAQLAALEARPGAGAAYSWTRYIDETGRELRPQTPVYFQGDVYRALLVRNFLCSGSNILIRREVVEQVGGFDPTALQMEDWEFFVRVAARWHFALVPRYQILYRYWSQSLSWSMASNQDLWEQSGRRTIERVFAAAPAPWQPLKRRRLARFHFRLGHRCLVMARDAAGVRRAGQSLWRAVSQDPRLLLDREHLRVLAKWALMRGLPARVWPALTLRWLSFRGGRRPSRGPERRTRGVPG
jgi:cellulose synthase/poly-beta-1,6-N-acetylglucosamine synthase-like glycosyltransferase